MLRKLDSVNDELWILCEAHIGMEGSGVEDSELRTILGDVFGWSFSNTVDAFKVRIELAQGQEAFSDKLDSLV